MAEFAVDTRALRAAAAQVAGLVAEVDGSAAAAPAHLVRAGEHLEGARCGTLVAGLGPVASSALAGLATALVELRHGLAAATEGYEAAEAAATVRATAATTRGAAR